MMKPFLFNLSILLVLVNFATRAQQIQYKQVEGMDSGSLEFNGLVRTYDIFMPATIEKTLPLVIMLHGGGGNSKEAAYSTNWITKAKNEGFIIVFPNGIRPDTTKPAAFKTNGQSWNDGSTRNLYAVEKNIDDVGFIRALVEELCRKYQIDRRRIYATGFSNGASMSFRLGVACSDIFAAIAPVSGSLWLENPSLKEPVSLLYITGDSDPLNPLNGGEVKVGKRSFGTKKTVKDIIKQWADMLKANYDTAYNAGDANVNTINYVAPKAEIRYITVKGLGHHWPGGKATLPEWLVGKPSNALNATNAIWEFFFKHSKMP